MERDRWDSQPDHLKQRQNDRFQCDQVFVSLIHLIVFLCPTLSFPFFPLPLPPLLPPRCLVWKAMSRSLPRDLGSATRLRLRRKEGVKRVLLVVVFAHPRPRDCRTWAGRGWDPERMRSSVSWARPCGCFCARRVKGEEEEEDRLWCLCRGSPLPLPRSCWH